MPEAYDPLKGARLAREVIEDRIVDEITGDVVSVPRNIRESYSDADGRIDLATTNGSIIGACGHPIQVGEAAGTCVECTKKHRRAVLICAACLTQCAECGKTICRSHARPGEDGNNYCVPCRRRLFRKPSGLWEFLASWW